MSNNKKIKQEIHATFVGYKPSGVSSNQFLGQLKRKYNALKAGYSGTLDPFAKGVLIIAFGDHTRLFRFLKKSPKTYRATLWLGACSETLDIEKVTHIDQTKEVELSTLRETLKSLEGELTYLPPKYSAKKIDGKRAYELARDGEEFKLNAITSTIYDLILLHYCHPFITFEATVSEGTYIRSLGQMICEKLHIENGSLSALERLSEGDFRYNCEKFLDIKECLDMEENSYHGDKNNFLDGKTLNIDDFEIKSDGVYYVENSTDTFSIIEIENAQTKYLLNKVKRC